MEPSVCDERVYQELYENHFTSLRNFCYYKCGDRDKASDLAQDAFTKMWLNCGKVIYDKAVGFLHVTANRLFLNTIERNKVALKFQKGVTERTNREDPSFILEEKEFKTQLEEAISSLKEEDREALLMNRIDKLTYKEIAARLDVSEKTVERRMQRALSQLVDKVKSLKDHKI